LGILYIINSLQKKTIEQTNLFLVHQIIYKCDWNILLKEQAFA